MKDTVRVLLGKRTIRQSMVTMSGTLVSGVLGAVSYIWVARLLGPTDYGVFAVAMATVGLVASVANLGTDTGLVMFVGKYWREQSARALKLMKLGLLTKLGAWGAILISGWFVIPAITQQLLFKPELTSALRIALVGVGGALLFSYVAACNQALQRFITWSGLLITTNIVRIILVVLLVTGGYFSLNSGLWVFILVPFMAFAGGVVMLPKFWWARGLGEVKREFFGYNKWVASFTVLTAISSRLDTYLAVRFLKLDEVGIYAVAVTLATFVSQFTLAIATVVAPKLSAMKNDREAFVYLKKLQMLVLVLAVLGLAVGMISGWYLIPYMYGTVYSGSFAPFVYLLLAQIIFFIAVPAHSAVMYYFSYPKLFVGAAMAFMTIVIVMGWGMVQSYGMVGLGMTMLVAQSVNLMIPFIWVMKKFSVRNENGVRK